MGVEDGLSVHVPAGEAEAVGVSVLVGVGVKLGLSITEVVGASATVEAGGRRGKNNYGYSLP